MCVCVHYTLYLSVCINSYIHILHVYIHVYKYMLYKTLHNYIYVICVTMLYKRVVNYIV